MRSMWDLNGVSGMGHRSWGTEIRSRCARGACSVRQGLVEREGGQRAPGQGPEVLEYHDEERASSSKASWAAGRLQVREQRRRWIREGKGTIGKLLSLYTWQRMRKRSCASFFWLFVVVTQAKNFYQSLFPTLFLGFFSLIICKKWIMQRWKLNRAAADKGQEWKGDKLGNV